MKPLRVGHENVVDADKILAVSIPNSNSIKRTIGTAKESNKVVDMTAGRTTKSVLIMTNGWIVLSSLTTETIVNRINGEVPNNNTKKTKEE